MMLILHMLWGEANLRNYGEPLPQIVKANVFNVYAVNEYIP
jgi:hypothetical protein